MALSEKDRRSLQIALNRLERQSFAQSLATKLGRPIDLVANLLPTVAHEKFDLGVQKALEGALHVAVESWTPSSASPRSRWLHTAATTIGGGISGFFGSWAIAVELPVSTTVILHSIAGIARSHGEDLSVPVNRMACLEVLALGPGRDLLLPSESRYYSARIALAQVMRDAAAHVAERGLAEEGAPQLILFINRVAARFSVEVSERAAAGAIPLIGAAGGAALNLIFTTHFHNVADAHFTVRRLERNYGPQLVREEYDRLLDQFEGHAYLSRHVDG